MSKDPVASRATKLDLFLGKIRSIKSAIKLSLHGAWWGLLWRLRLSKAYSEFICQRGWYRKFKDGRCMYCGNKH